MYQSLIFSILTLVIEKEVLMLTNWNLKYITTFSVNKILIEVSKEKNVEISDLLRNTFQFLYVLDNFSSYDIYEICTKITNEYEISEKIGFSKETVIVKTHLTKAQSDAYELLPKQARTTIVNKLMSIAINNTSYSNAIYSELKKVTKNKIINQFTIDFFINDKFCNDQDILEIKTYLIESILGKLSHTIKYKNIGKSFYKNLYMQLFSLDDYTDFCFQELEAEFLLEQFKKIYFCMLEKYKIKVNIKSSTSNARKIKQENKILLKEKYEKNIEKYIANEIAIDDTLNKSDQSDEFEFFLRELHPDIKLQSIIDLMLPTGQKNICFSI